MFRKCIISLNDRFFDVLIGLDLLVDFSSWRFVNWLRRFNISTNVFLFSEAGGVDLKEAESKLEVFSQELLVKGYVIDHNSIWVNRYAY